MTADTLFASGRWRARELGPADVPALQALFDANPGYFRTVNGRDALANEAQLEFDERPPPHMTYKRQWVAGLYDGGDSDELLGTAVVVSDLNARAVWHLGLLFVATRLHGSGAAQEIYAALEAWMHAGGAQWLRLGVVAGNARAERFWSRLGYREVRRRDGIDTGGRINTVRVLVKPLAGGSIESYLELVPRDRPGSALA